MKFIIPQNYNLSSKFLGFLDYSSAIIISLWCLFVFCIVSFIFHSLYLKIFLIIVLCFPFIIFCFVGFNHENIIYVLSYLLKFAFSQKIYLYQKNPIVKYNKKWYNSITRTIKRSETLLWKLSITTNLYCFL